MARRPTIPDLAQAAGVSVSTVNRVLRHPGAVRPQTRDLVVRAAQDIGFYGLGSIEHAVRTTRATHRMGVLLLQGRRPFYRILAQALRRAAAACQETSVEIAIEHVDDLSPAHVAQRIRALEDCASVALVAAEHPLVSDAIDSLLARGIPVAGLIAPQVARGQTHFVGLDYFRVGRTAGWAFDRLCRSPCKLGILLGSHRYRNQEMNESGFRSYFREHNPAFTLLEPRFTFETAEIARSETAALLAEHPDLGGLYVSGGGISGALAALREAPRSPDFVCIGYELMDVTRAALIEGTLTMVISHPVDRLARATVETLVQAAKTPPGAGARQVTLGFDIHVSENI